MHTTDCYGGITLGAFAGGRLVGYSYALPGFDGARPFLLSCGLAVAQACGSRGVGEALKRAQAQRASRAGYDLIRWTTNSLASRPLHLYLSKLGARLVGYRAEMYAGLREDVFCDEVEIEWDLRRAPAAPAAESPVPLIVTRDPGAGVTSLTAPSYAVEIPWDRAALARRSPQLAREWVAAARSVMRALLAAGYVGTAVIADRRIERSSVRFDR
jgi:predicted GNAT superfamily acetyltransferase